MSKPRKIRAPIDDVKRPVTLAIKLVAGQMLERFHTFLLTEDDLEFMLDQIHETGGEARVLS